MTEDEIKAKEVSDLKAKEAETARLQQQEREQRARPQTSNFDPNQPKSVMDQNREAAAAKARGEPVDVVSNVAPTVTINPQDQGSVEKQHAAVDERMDKLNANNEKGQAKIVEREEKIREASQANPTHVPTGKEWNRNTPVMDEFGNKSW